MKTDVILELRKLQDEIRKSAMDDGLIHVAHILGPLFELEVRLLEEQGEEFSLPRATQPEDIILSEEQEKQYNKLVEAIGVEGLTLIHLQHYKDFLVQIDAVKREAVEEYKLQHEGGAK